MSYVTFLTKRGTTGTTTDAFSQAFVVNGTNTLNFPCTVADFSSEIDREVSVSLSGIRETIFHRVSQKIGVSTGWLTAQELTNFKCFLLSVSGGESFLLSVYGSAGDNDAVTAYLESAGFSVSRNGVLRRYKVSFDVILGDVE
jgi:hypothetical protein